MEIRGYFVSDIPRRAFLERTLKGGLVLAAGPSMVSFLEGCAGREMASAKVEEELLRVINEYGQSLKSFVENAGDRLYSQIEEVLEQIQEERAANRPQEELLAEVEERLVSVRSVARVLKASRERLAESVVD